MSNNLIASLPVSSEFNGYKGRILKVSNIQHYLSKDNFAEEFAEAKLFLVLELLQVPYGNPYCP